MKKVYNCLFLLLIIFPFRIHSNNPPLGFIENKGQIHDQNFKPNPEVKYLLSIPGMNVQLKGNSFSYDTYTVEERKIETTRSKITKSHLKETENIYHFHRVDLEFIGANAIPEIISEDPSETYYNYYTSGTNQHGLTNVRSFEKIIYKNLYPNIDLEFITNAGKVKYNFILHYGADISQIKWQYKGAENTILEKNNISIKVKQGVFQETIPESFINRNGGKSKNTSIGFKIISDNTFGFYSVENIKLSKEQVLVIDPIPNVLWATYFGGSGPDYFNSLCTDTVGNIYLTGHTGSPSLIATTGSFQNSFGGGTYDVVISRFSKSGALKWSTYYGRTGDDAGSYVVINKIGELFVSGVTNSSSSMATSGSHQFTFGGGSEDAFLAKFDTTGMRIWSTYYGGSGYDDSYGSSLDPSGNVYLSGSTNSTASISTSGSHQVAFGGGPYDAYLIKFNTNGVRQWGTYYGGIGDDGSATCVNDCLGNLYLCGYTSSTSSISTIGSHQSVYGGGSYDGYLIKFATNGIRQWATYYGGTTLDCAQQICYDTLGVNLYIAGFSDSNNAISTIGSHQPINGGADDAFLVKFDTIGVRQWSTYYGDVGIERGSGVSVDNLNVYLCGLTDSPNSIATSGALMGSFSGGGKDAYLAKFSKSGIRQWGTYYGGTGYELGSATLVDSYGSVYLIGETSTYSIMATSGAYQTVCAGGYDAYCAKFNDALSTNITHQQIEYNNLGIFPNPNNGSFSIQTKEYAVLNIVNELGQIVKTIKLDQNNNHKSSIQNLTSGVYFLSDSYGKNLGKVVVIK